jgi:hypothetical protein
MKMEALEDLNLNIAPATVTAGQQSHVNDDLEVHVGRHFEMHTPRRQRHHREPGLVIGKL